MKQIINILSRIFFAGGIALVSTCFFSSCRKISPSTDKIGEITFSAISQPFGPTTRTYLFSTSTNWRNGDSIRINSAVSRLKTGADTKYGTFPCCVTGKGTDKNEFIAAYPVTNSAYTAGSGTSIGTVTLTIPSAQHFREDTTLVDIMPMAAFGKQVGDNNVSLNFKNAANILKLMLWGEDQVVDKIILTSNNAYLAGTLVATPSEADGITFGNWTGLSKRIILRCDSPVTIGSTAETATAFYILIPQMTENTVITIKTYNTIGSYQVNTITVNDAKNTNLKNYTSNYICATDPTKFTPNMTQGSLPGLFSVSQTKRVHFSKGNLQYIASGTIHGEESYEKPYWRFANNQMDVMHSGSTDTCTVGYISSPDAWNNSTSTTAVRDLFGWGASGLQDIYGTAVNPYQTSENAGDYHSSITGKNQDDALGICDWGRNTIVNGGGSDKNWRTLTANEMYYLLATRRVTVGGKDQYPFAFATIDGHPTMIILPDTWDGSVCGTLKYGTVGNNKPKFTDNTISDTSTVGWQELEDAGCVFLPVDGYRRGMTFNYANIAGHYCLSSSYSGDNSYELRFSSEQYFSMTNSINHTITKSYGQFVRLVTDVRTDISAITGNYEIATKELEWN